MSVAAAIGEGRIGSRLWMYANYHCNLRCSYCLTESGPGVLRRQLGRGAMIERALEARELGFTGLGITGGEPFLLDDMPERLAELAQILPVVVLSNGTLFHGRRLAALDSLRGLPVEVQISLDSAEPDENDEMRGPENFAKVVAAIPELLARGIGVRIATTLNDPDAYPRAAMDRLCALHRGLGVSDAHHVVRPIVRRGRAATGDMGVVAGFDELEPELTLTADGAFASPFGPTIRDGRLDTDLLVSRTTAPVAFPAALLARAAGAHAPGSDARLGIR
ncbi:MAG: radical SAM protein [Solirubrobacteraceae bacterium]